MFPVPAVSGGLDAAIDVCNLSVSYGSLQALKSVSLTLKPRRALALIGPSGCGKSTFLRTLNRMNDLVGARVQGRVRIFGQDVYSRDTDVVELRRRVGMVFQMPNPFPKSVFENVVYGLRRRGVKDRRILEHVVEESLRRVALWDEVKDRLHQSALSLSGGQQQRLCIARCLALEPEVVLMDEPAAALDPVATARIEELIHALKRDYTLVIVTHNLQQAARVSDETAVFLDGQLVEKGETGLLFSRPQDERTAQYLAGRWG